MLTHHHLNIANVQLYATNIVLLVVKMQLFRPIGRFCRPIL